MVALKAKGYSMNTMDKAQLEEAKNALITQKPLVQAYVIDQVRDKMIGGEAALGVIYSGEAIYTQRENADLEYVIPEEGTNVWIDGWVVPKNAPNKEKVQDGMTILSALTDWALEGSVVTGDAMRSRGYGAARRSSFMIYRMTGIDVFLLVLQCILMAATFATVITGGARADFTPDLFIAPLKGLHVPGFMAYCAYLMIPTILHIKETVQWHISRSKICAFHTPRPEAMNR
jgi:hypothetical protein